MSESALRPMLDVPDATALMQIANRFAAAADVVHTVRAAASGAADLPDVLAYGPGDQLRARRLAAGTEGSTVSPQRLQRRRTKGYRMPEGAIFVGRPTKWGNPFKVGEALAQEPGIGGDYIWLLTAAECVELYRLALIRRPAASMRMACPGGSFVTPTIQDVVAELAGRDLVCWCPPGPCHADVLLTLANSDRTQDAEADGRHAQEGHLVIAENLAGEQANE